MADPTGEADKGALRLDFDRRLMLQFRGSTITSDAGLLAYRELDNVLRLTDTAADTLADARTGKNGRHRLAGLLRQSVFGRLAGYEDVNDAERLCRDPAMRWGSYCSILVPIWNSRRRTRARAARKTWSTQPVSINQNGTVVALRPQQTKIAAASPKRPPPRGRNAERRPREFLTPDEVDRLVVTAKERGRWGQRDAAAILLAFSHGLRVSKLVALTWAQIDFRDGVIHVRRRKNGRDSTQPLRGAEVRVLKQLRREWPEGQFIL